MAFEQRYRRMKEALLADSAICRANRALFEEFFEYEEYKLKRRNGLAKLDEACYKTLCGYVTKFRNVSAWFNNKPWKQLTKADIKRVYDDLEEGRITNREGQPFRDRRGYYNKVFRSKPFRMVGKAEWAREVMEFYTEAGDRDVRYVTEESFRKLVSVLSKPTHLLLCWLAWDIGENISTLLQLTRRDFIQQKNAHTGEPEYLVNLPKDKIKRSRQTRSEPTLYPETVRFAEMALADLKDAGRVFNFGYRQASKILRSAVIRSGARCMPHNDPISWKDLRSGMACHLLKSGWSRDEVNARLGHKPSSRVLDAYINYLAIDRRAPKKKLYQTNLEAIQNEVEEAKRREKLAGERIRRRGEENEALRAELDRTKQDLGEIKRMVAAALAAQGRSSRK